MLLNGSPVPFADRALPQWFDDAKFGIFIHWGPYAVPCYAPVDRDMGDLMKAGDWEEVFRWSPYTEWYLNSWSLPGSPVMQHHEVTYGAGVTYRDFVDEFITRSAGCSTADWVPLFAQSGARYVVPVTKHHDGFLMWHSEVPNPFLDRWMAARDHIDELAGAVRDAGLRFGLYYSGGIDWTFNPPPVPDLVGLFRAVPDSVEYHEYLLAHVRELTARYRPSVLWNDIGWPASLDPNEMIGEYYSAVPDGVVNDRFNMIAVAQGRLHADFSTPEYNTTSGATKWEVCRGIGRSFGYNRMESDATLSSADDLIWMLVDIVARGGNLLLNVGPSADGQIPFAQALRLTALGWWLRINGAAIFETRPGGVGSTADGRQVAFTRRDGVRFAIVRGAPHDEVSFACEQPGEGAEVRMLGSSRVLPHSWNSGSLRVVVPDHLPPAPATAFSITG